MPLSLGMLGLILVVASAAALGLSILVDVGKYSAERARQAMLNRQLEKKRQALSEWKAKSEKKVIDLRDAQAKLAELLGRKQRALAEIKSLQLSKIEFVHEIGDPSDGAIGFWTQLAVIDNFASVDRHDILFSRQIWDYRNVAHIWANGLEHAHTVINQSVTPRSGVQPTQMLPLAFAPDGSVVEPAS